jgi:hypothetical protein
MHGFSNANLYHNSFSASKNCFIANKIVLETDHCSDAIYMASNIDTISISTEYTSHIGIFFFF